MKKSMKRESERRIATSNFQTHFKMYCMEYLFNIIAAFNSGQSWKE